MSKTEPGRVVHPGMGGFLNPPTHPEHDWHVETDLRRRPHNRGGISLSAAAATTWLDAATRAEAKKMLKGWQPPPINSPEIVDWRQQVLGYYRGCYRNPGAPKDEQWHASNVIIDQQRDPVANADDHAGVHLIRKFYPNYVPTEEDFKGAYWGSRPESATVHERLHSHAPSRRPEGHREHADKSLYDALVAGGQKVDHHESDLYVKRTPEADRIIRAHGGAHTKNATTFISNTDGAEWIDIPFAYSPWWDKHASGRQAPQRAHQTARGPHRRVARERDDDWRKYSMTYGVLPSFAKFKKDVSTRIDPDYDRPYWPKGTLYPMELVGQHEIELADEFGGLDKFDTSRPGYAYGFRGNERQIYEFLTFLAKKNDEGDGGDEDTAGDLASSIMTTLGYEWI